MPGLVLFLHGLTGNQNSWGAVPDYVQKSSLGSDFEVATPEYSAILRSPSTIEISAGQILTLIKTKYAEHDPIFLVGHSLGGLIARELSCHLLLSGPDDILNKIPAIITVGTPLEGARIGNFFLRFVPFFSKKLRELATPKYAFNKYRQAIRKAKERTVRRPKQLHIQIEDDRVISRHAEGYFTEDDVMAGILPGTHTNFASQNEDASYVADVLLRLIRSAHISVSRPNIKPPEHVANAQLPDQLVLIACSHTKREGGQKSFQGPAPAEWIPQQSLRQRVISKSTYVYSLLHDAKLADGFERGGNRAHQAANVGLRYGPDLGGTSVINDEGNYLPAFKRYTGRIYVPVTETAWHTLAQNRHRLRVLIMSGLYGLIEPDEWIQNYDVHLTDTNEDNGQSVSSMWAELFTESLDAYVRHAHRNRKVRILNLLCDHYYTLAVQWHALSSDCSVYHLASPTLEDVKLLPPAGLILNSILLEPDRIQSLERDNVRYPLSDFGLPPAGLAGTEVIFESRVGLSKRNSR
jgi:pimeloyl-ACP methyl ester carboxylesterase